MRNTFFILIVCIGFLSCQKESVQLAFEKINVPVNQRITDLCFVNENIGFACGGQIYNNGFVLRTLDGGNTWTIVSNTSPDILIDIDFLNDTLGYAVGISGVVMRTEDGGDNWGLVNFRTYEFLNSVFLFSANELIAVGGVGERSGLFAPLLNWETQDWGYQSIESNLLDVEFTDKNNGLACGYGVVFHTENGGENWNPLGFEGDIFSDMDFPSSTTGYMCGYQGGVFKTNNGGKNWQTLERTNGLFGERVYFEAIDFIDNYTGFIAGHNGKLAITRDGGDVIQFVNTPSTVNFRTVCLKEDKTTGFVAGDNGELWKFTY